MTGSIVGNTNSNIAVNGNYSNSSPVKSNGVTANGEQQYSPINNLNSSNYNINGSQNNSYNYSGNQNGQQFNQNGQQFNQNGQQFNQNQNMANNYNTQYPQGNNYNSNQSNLRNPLDVIAERQSDNEVGKNISGFSQGR